MNDRPPPRSQDVGPERWTLLIAAAGRGSRLGWTGPKVLYPLNGQPILSYILSSFHELTSKVVMVVSPQAVETIRTSLEAHPRWQHTLTIQHNPIGMADAVRTGLAAVTTEFVAIVWGDQAAIRRETIAHAARHLTASNQLAGVVPVLQKAAPYIHFDVDPSGRITRVLQAREGDAMPGFGESDAGVFFIRVAALRAALSDGTALSGIKGAKTGELNFLPLLKTLDATGRILRLAGITASEAAGINTPTEASDVALHLKSRIS